MSKKQATLFQSWGNKAKGLEQRSVQPVPQPSTSSAENNVIDLCGSFEDDDDDLLCEAEESVANISKHSGPALTTSHHTSQNDRKHADLSEHFEAQHVGDISIGADGFTPTQAQTQSCNIPGFDKSAGKLWIYPTNYPVREYQFKIVHQALFKNTMVTLPTGLGKTFIAAVVMYNFYRWYPQGKVIFMAPTKPLVAQQIEACYNIMGIPQDHTAEMTGSMGPSKREKAWHDKRVFFLTPQVLTNDLSRGSCPAHDVKCLVIDEAHKALGNHAYCQVVRELVKYTENFRILALSATPGSDIKAVQQVLTNLLISQIEIRTEESIDIKRYSHERKVDKVVVPLGDELTKVKTKYIQIMDVIVNRLKRHGVLYNKDTTSLSKFLILKAREAFRQNPPERLQRNQYGIVEGDFALAMSLYHGYELLQLHGSRSLYNFLDGILTGEKGYGRTRTELTRNADFNELMGLLSGKYTVPESETASQARAKPFVIGHPKMEKLQEIVLDHFNTHSDAGTRVMIFSQYRDSVQEITNMLDVHQPVVKVMSFIGQATAGKSTKGFTQKEQLKVMKQFREGGYNTLVSTCVGEEGLDIGDVDLIICFDAHKSPIRLVQRMGRTGRKREGRIVMLVTQGKEEQIYNQSQYSKKSIHKAILNGAKSLHFYQNSPRMLPENLTPTCHKMHITVKENFKPTKKITTAKDLNQSKITTMINEAASKKDQSDEIITLEEYRELEPWLVPEKDIPKLPPCKITCLGETDTDEVQEKNGRFLSLSEWSPWQNTLQETELVDHSLASKHLVQLMEFIQLQQSLDPNDDPYGLEMAAYLNEEDILKPGEVEAPLIVRFGVQSKSNEMKGKPEKKSGGKSKVRRSDNLPNFDFLENKMDVSSDESLPEFNVGGEDLRKTYKNGKLELVDKRKRDITKKSVSDNSLEGNKDRYGIDEVGSDIHQVMDISDEAENCISESNERIIDSKKESSNTKKVHLISKAKSLEKRMNISIVRKRKKSRHNSGQTSIIQLIADNDSSDFDGVDEISKTMTKKSLDVDKGAGNNVLGNLDDKKCYNLSDGSDSELCTVGSLKELTNGCFRIRTPPPVEEVVKLCEALENGTNLINIDLIAAIDEWHRENKDGKYIVYPRNMMNDSYLNYTSQTKSAKKKMSTQVFDVKVNESVSNKKTIKNDQEIAEMETDTPEKIKKNVSEERSPESMLKNNNLSKTPLDSLDSNGETRLHTPFDSSKEIGRKRKGLFNSPANQQEIGKESVKENELKLSDIEGDIDVNNKQEEEENIACTGNFILNADDMFSTNNDWLDEELNEEYDKPHKQVSEVSAVSRNEKSASKQKNNTHMYGTDLEKADTSGNKSLFSKVKKHRSKHSFIRLDDLGSSNSNDDSVANGNMSVPFSDLNKPNYDSFFADDKDDDLFMDMKTPSISKQHETSTQITFTQALDFVHSGSCTSGSSGSCSETHYKGISKNHTNKSFTSSNPSKNCMTEIASPKFSLKNSLKASKSGDGSISEGDIRTGDCSKDSDISLHISNENNEDITQNKTIFLEKSSSRKSSLSSENGVEMPEFDLGFDFDDDIIPPSPKATQASQKSNHGRLSQAFAFTNRLSQSRFEATNETISDERDEESAEKTDHINSSKQTETVKVRKNVFKSKKSLNLDSERKEAFINHVQHAREEESQSLLDDIPNVILRHRDKKSDSSVASSRGCLEAIQEHSENESIGCDDIDAPNSAVVNKSKVETRRESPDGDITSYNTKFDEDAEHEQEDICTGAFETSFALLGEDLDEWIDSGGDNLVHNDWKEASVANENVKEIKANSGDENSCNSCLSSQKSIVYSQRKLNTPVAAVSPISFSQELQDKQTIQTELLPLKTNKNIRKSVFKLDDLSQDSFDDSFDFTSDMLIEKNIPENNCSLPSVRHNTSTPLIKQTRKVQSVTPFRVSVNSTPVRVIDTTPVRKSETSIKLAENASPFTVLDTTPVNNNRMQRRTQTPSDTSRVEPLDEMDDDSFIVRRKKRVQILDSPLSQREDILKHKILLEERTERNGKKSKRCTALSSSSDNDEFDDSFLLNKNKYLAKKTAPCLGQSSDEDFEESILQPKTNIPWKNSTKDSEINTKGKESKQKMKAKYGVNRKRTSNPFIEEEADLSEDADGDASSDEHEGSDLDTYEGSFIANSQCTQSQALNDTDIHALYLKSVKSPLARRGGFKLQYNHRNDIDVFSQRPPPEQSHYMEDSFCVGSEEEEDGWLLGEEGHESEEELREVTMMQNTLIQTGRKRRRGLQAFQTSRQRAIQVGRMKALSEIRSKLAGKTKRPAQKQNISISSSEEETEKRNAPKRSRIHLQNDTSSEDENKLSLNGSDLTSPIVKPVRNAKKRAKLILSSDDSESEEFYESRNMCKTNKSVKVVNKNATEINNAKTLAANSKITAEELRQERLRKQKAKQEEYRRQLEEKKNINSKNISNENENSANLELTKIKEKSGVSCGIGDDDFEFAKPLKDNNVDNSDLLICSSSKSSRFHEKLVILVDSKEISGSQDIISDMRFKHDIHVSAAQLPGCDYIVSNRMAVERKQWSEFSNGTNRAKLVERMQHLGELYDRPCLIVEKDRIKPGEEKSTRPVHWTKYVDRTLALLQRSEIKVMFTDNFTETAELLADLCRLEQRKNMAISVRVELNDEQHNRVKFYVSIPKLSYIHALNLSDGFRSVTEFLKSSAVVIETRGKMSRNRALEVYNYIRRKFDQNMLPTNYK